MQLQLCLPQHHGQRDHPGADEPQEKYEALNAIMRHMTGRNWEMPEPAVARVSVFAIRAERWTGKRSPAN